MHPQNDTDQSAAMSWMLQGRASQTPTQQQHRGIQHCHPPHPHPQPPQGSEGTASDTGPNNVTFRAQENGYKRQRNSSAAPSKGKTEKKA